jgi:hypothetical protein
VTLYSVRIKTHEETDNIPHGVIYRPVGSTKKCCLKWVLSLGDLTRFYPRLRSYYFTETEPPSSGREFYQMTLFSVGETSRRCSDSSSLVSLGDLGDTDQYVFRTLWPGTVTNYWSVYDNRTSPSCDTSNPTPPVVPMLLAHTYTQVGPLVITTSPTVPKLVDHTCIQVHWLSQHTPTSGWLPHERLTRLIYLRVYDNRANSSNPTPSTLPSRSNGSLGSGRRMGKGSLSD